MSVACTVPKFDDHERLYGLARTVGADIRCGDVLWGDSDPSPISPQLRR